MKRNKFLWVLNYNTAEVYVGEYSEGYLNTIGVENILERLGFSQGDCHYMVSDYSDFNQLNSK